MNKKLLPNVCFREFGNRNCEPQNVALSRSGWLSSLQRCLPRRWPGFDPLSQPDLGFVWKRWLFSVTVKFEVAKAKMFSQGNTAFKEQLKLKLVNGFERYMR
jgi:hypothetical protein